jgi:hypothetical protein
MPFNSVVGLMVQGIGTTNREAILNELKEAREEVRKLAFAVDKLEALVLAQPESGVRAKFAAVQATPLLAKSDFTPLLGWMLSLYESFYLMACLGIGSGWVEARAAGFAKTITEVNSISLTLARK